MWEFSTDPPFQRKLDWAETFVRNEIEPLDLLWPDHAFQPLDDHLRPIVQPLKDRVRAEGLWACHLGPELGGQGYGQVKLALLNEILGRSMGNHDLGWAPVIFGTQAPDSGNAEILAHYGTAEQKRQYLQPLLDGEIFSCFSMTEPQGGADPEVFTTEAHRDGKEWVINGEKYFASHAAVAAFIIVMARTDPSVRVHRGSSMFLVPAGTSGMKIARAVGTGTEPLGTGTHAVISFQDCRVPEDNLLGAPGEGFTIAQTRLSAGRLHHAMRAVAQCRIALDMLAERALSRFTKGSLLAEKQAVQAYVAESFMQLTQLRLLVLQTAWLIDQGRPSRKEVAACKVLAAKALIDIIGRAAQVHGAMGMSNELPLARMWMQAPWMGVMDGPTEVHIGTIARHVLKEYSPAQGPFPFAYLPVRIEAARRHFEYRNLERNEHPSSSGGQ